MLEKRSIGFAVCTLANAIKRRTDELVSNCVDYEITRMQSWVIGYIHQHSDSDIFQRDIENRFNIRRSTATGILQLMEKNGLIKRESVEHDARLKKIILTPKAVDIQKSICAVLEQTDSEISSILTAQEQETFIQLSEKLINSICSDDDRCSKDERSCSDQ